MSPPVLGRFTTPNDSPIQGDSAVQKSSQSEFICPSDLTSKVSNFLTKICFGSIPLNSAVVDVNCSQNLNAHVVSNLTNPVLPSIASPIAGISSSFTPPLAATSTLPISAASDRILSNCSQICNTHPMLTPTMCSPLSMEAGEVANRDLEFSQQTLTPATGSAKLKTFPTEFGQKTSGSLIPMASPAFPSPPRTSCRVNLVESFDVLGPVDSGVVCASSPVVSDSVMIDSGSRLPISSIPASIKHSQLHQDKVGPVPARSFKDVISPNLTPVVSQSFVDISHQHIPIHLFSFHQDRVTSSKLNNPIEPKQSSFLSAQLLSGTIFMILRTKSKMMQLRFLSVSPYSMPLARKFSTSHEAVEQIFRIISTSPNARSLLHSIEASQISLSNELIDRILKRVRFSHANPLSALEFFNIASRKKGFFHTSFSLDTMLYVLGRSHKFELVWELLVEYKRKDRSLITPRTLQVVLGRIAKVCSVRQTVLSFKRFKKVVSVFDASCYNALFRTLCQEKSMTDARNVYHNLKHEFRPNLHTFNIMLSGWKSAEEAEAFFVEMRKMGVEPDVVSYNCLVDVYCKGRELEKAHKVMKEMRENGVDLDVITYTSLIGGLGLVGQPDKAREILKEMNEYGCYPDVAAYNAVIRNFCIAKRISDARHMLEELIDVGLSPNATTYNLFFRTFYWVNDLRSSWYLYLRMRKTGCLPNTQSCMFLIRLMHKQEKDEMALELWNDMVDKGFGSFTLVSDVLFDMLCDMGKLEEAEKCFLQMVEKGQKPSSLSFRRIKVLMELANKQEALSKLSEKMSAFGSTIHLGKSAVDELERPVSDFTAK